MMPGHRKKLTFCHCRCHTLHLYWWNVFVRTGNFLNQYTGYCHIHTMNYRDIPSHNKSNKDYTMGCNNMENNSLPIPSYSRESTSGFPIPLSMTSMVNTRKNNTRDHNRKDHNTSCPSKTDHRSRDDENG